MDFFKRPVKEISVIKLLWLFDSNSQWMSVLISLHHLYTSRCNTLPLILLVKLIPNKPTASNEKKRSNFVCFVLLLISVWCQCQSHRSLYTHGIFFTIFLCRAKLRGFLRGNENLTNMHCVGLLCYSTSKWTAKHPLFLSLWLCMHYCHLRLAITHAE